MLNGGTGQDLLLEESDTLPIHSFSNHISVLHVDDNPEITTLTAEFLQRELDDVEVISETDVEEGLTRIKEDEIDCVVSDYDMPKMDGLGFLSQVREEYPDLPFILFTGKGSEEIAADAISAGVTDYLQKGGGADQYTVLANRIENAVSQYRAEQAIEETGQWYRTILEHSSDYVMIVDGNADVKYVTPPIERVMGYSPEDVIGEHSFEFVHPDDFEGAMLALSEIIQDPTIEKTVEFRAQHNDGSWRWLEVRGRNLLDDPVINGVMVNVRDITERKKREEALERQSHRLEDLTGFLTHDLRNQLNVLEGRLELAREQSSCESLEAAGETLQRISEMVDNFTELSQRGRIPTDTESVTLSKVADTAWNAVMPVEATLEIQDDEPVQVTADEERLRALLENLFQNAKDHVGSDVTVTIGPLEDYDGFFVEDDGPGIPEEDRDDVLTPGFTTEDGGQGFGLAIVNQITEAHGWDLTITNESSGGARFEFRTEEL